MYSRDKIIIALQMWLLRSGEDAGAPIILYKYAPTRAGDNAMEFLEGFCGYLMCDGIR